METEKVPKRNIRKTFRNIWLFSMLAFAIVGVLWILITWIFKLPQFSGYAPLIIFSLIGLVGGISFLIWISMLIFSKPFKIFEILIGIILASYFYYTVKYILIIYLGNRGVNENLFALDLLIPLVLFGMLCFVWIKTRKIVLKGILVLIVLVTFLLGRAYAMNTYQSLVDAQTLYKEAYSTSGFAAVDNTTETNKYLEVERKYVALVKEASEKPKGALSSGKQLYVKLYEFHQKVLDLDEKLLSGQLVLTEEEINKMTEDGNKEKLALFEQGYFLPPWFGFFRVK